MFRTLSISILSAFILTACGDDVRQEEATEESGQAIPDTTAEEGMDLVTPPLEQTVELQEQQVRMRLPEGWHFQGFALNNEEGKKMGEVTVGIMKPTGGESCETLHFRLKHGGEAIETEGGMSYSFGEEGGDVESEIFYQDRVFLDNLPVYRSLANATMTYNGADTFTTYYYCKQMDDSTMFAFNFYTARDADTTLYLPLFNNIIGSVEYYGD